MPIYVQHEVLGRIPDVFNAEAIWQAPGLALFSRRPLLRDLLERCPREHRGRAATRCFSHVTLMLPQEEVEDDYHLTRGSRARELAQTLTALHQKDFGDLLGNDQVRYDVLGKEQLAPGEVEVRFGHAVYLPAPGEQVLFNVSVSRDSAVWKPVCPIYPNQRLSLISGSDNAASYAASGWPFGDDSAVLLLNDGPDTEPVVQMRPRDAFDCSFDARQGYYLITSKRSGGEAQAAPSRLLLRITRSSAAPSPRATQAPSAPASIVAAPGRTALTGRPRAALPDTPPAIPTPSRPAVWQTRPGTEDDDELTAMPLPAGHSGAGDDTYAPALGQQRVSLVALALPRLSRYRATGAAALEVPFNRTLGVNTDSSTEKALSIVVNDNDELYAYTEAGRQRIAAPASFTPVDTRSIRLLATPQEMSDRYCATLCLAEPLSAAVTSGARLSFGRASAALASLRILDSPRFLKRSGGPDGASADRIGLSRNAFSFEAAPQGFRIGRLTPTQALYHLDEQLQFIASIGDASADVPYLLPAGHHLVAGHYVLRFDA
jgi:hypothetical protein